LAYNSELGCYIAH